MNTFMWEHPLTAKHIRIIEQDIGYRVVGPVGKVLACGDIGKSIDKEVKSSRKESRLTNSRPWPYALKVWEL
jgi:phosphopantothenoylcysteine synthetase/decarboxylase